jgi:predicted RNase H-like HicB family nuclease
MARSFTLEYWQEEGWFVGRLKEVPGVFSQGETLDELKENILEAYNLMIEEERKVLAALVKSKTKAIRVEV